MINEKKLIEDFKNTFSDSVLNQTFGFGKYTLLEAVEEMIERQPKTDWIPCEERLPSEENEECLVCKKNGVFMLIKWTKKGWNTYKCFDGTYFTESEIKDVLAWQPLPQPYKKEGAENE